MLSRQLREAGFALRHRAAIPMFNPEFEDNTYGKGMLAMMAAFTAGRNGVSQSEADAWLAASADVGRAGRALHAVSTGTYLLRISGRQP